MFVYVTAVGCWRNAGPLTLEAALDRVFREDSPAAHGVVLQFRAKAGTRPPSTS